MPDLAIPGERPKRAIRLGLKENWPQFALLVLVNAFVGGMVGIECDSACNIDPGSGVIGVQN